MLEDLMDKLQFRGKPKIVDLTSQRKLADKVRYLSLHRERPAEAEAMRGVLLLRIFPICELLLPRHQHGCRELPRGQHCMRARDFS